MPCRACLNGTLRALNLRGKDCRSGKRRLRAASSPGHMLFDAKPQARNRGIEIESCIFPMAAKLLEVSSGNECGELGIMSFDPVYDSLVTIQGPMGQRGNILRLLRRWHDHVTQRGPSERHRRISTDCGDQCLEPFSHLVRSQNV